MNDRRLPTAANRRFVPVIQRILLIVVAASLIISCARLLWRSWSVEEILRLEHQKLEQLELRKQELEQKIQTATSSFELERRAREELLLQASDESIWQRTE